MNISIHAIFLPKGIIIDIRNYPAASVAYSLGNYFTSKRKPFVRGTTGNINNPGEFYFSRNVEFIDNNAGNRYSSNVFETPTRSEKYFQGKLVVVVNEETISYAKYTAKAGRLLLPDKSENGKGITIISPFINLSMQDLLLWFASLLPVRFRLHNGLKGRCGFCGCLQKPCRQVCVQASPTIVHCSSFCFVLPMYPLFLFFRQKYTISLINHNLKNHLNCLSSERSLYY